MSTFTPALFYVLLTPLSSSLVVEELQVQILKLLLNNKDKATVRTVHIVFIVIILSFNNIIINSSRYFHRAPCQNLLQCSFSQRKHFVDGFLFHDLIVTTTFIKKYFTTQIMSLCADGETNRISCLLSAHERTWSLPSRSKHLLFFFSASADCERI